MEDERPPTDEAKREKKWSPGAIAMLIVLPLTLVLFGIDAVVLLEGDASDGAAHAKPAPTAQTPDAAASTNR